MCFFQEGRAQVRAPGFEPRLGVARGCQRIIKNALSLAACHVDDALSLCFRVQKAFEWVFHFSAIDPSVGPLG
jgi:hypothetical protein